MIIGILGRIGSGKDTVSDYLKKKNFNIVSFREMVVKLVNEKGLEPNRQNMQKISRKARDEKGEMIFSNMVLEEAEKIDGNIVIKDIRTKGDLEPLIDKFPNMRIFEVFADSDKRCERMIKRSRKGDPSSIEEFEIQEKKEMELGYTEAIKLSNLKIDNNGSFEDLYKNIEVVL